jgi:oligoendopeptidase F
MPEHVVNRVADIPRPSVDFPRKYVPETLDFDRWEAIEPLFKDLLRRPLNSASAIEEWLSDGSELSAVMEEESSRRYIAMTCATDDSKAENAYLNFVESIQPRMKPLGDQLNRKLLDSPHLGDLDPQRYAVLLRSVKNSVELFREANVPIETDLDKLSQQYQKLQGAMTVEFRGQERTMQQMSVFLEESDRTVRKEAWELSAGRRLKDVNALDDIFDQMLELRTKMAHNAGFDDFRAFQFRRFERFDYTPEDCLRFHEAVEKLVVPVYRATTSERRQALGVDTVRPWDMACDRYGRPPLKPFTLTTDLANGCATIFGKVDPELGSRFQHMIDLGLLDLDSRKGKAPGGYQTDLTEVRLPFIFTNAVGSNRDVFTLLHEGGHAFHAFAVRGEPLLSYRHAPMEFCEVASMGMELLGHPFLDVFYNEGDLAQARYDDLLGRVQFFPWCATVDAFQHWIYTHPGHSRTDRADYWVTLSDRFGSGVDHSGYEEVQRSRWQAQLHIFEYPFYYIEYGIALLGALQIWLHSLSNAPEAVGAYKKALSLGGSRPLPDLFRAAQTQFDFTEKTLAPLTAAVASAMGREATLEKR